MYWKEKIIGISKIKGDSNEIKCILAFIQLGWKVSIPYGEDSRYDLIVDRGNDLIRVQCKSCTLKDNKLTMWCMSNNKKLPLMPKATAIWLIDNTSLTFKQIANFCGLHEREVQGIADGDVARELLRKYKLQEVIYEQRKRMSF